ncbi:MAG: hypothetical protein ACTSYZ_02045 [Candidatus Helarchaeota archaeon]
MISELSLKGEIVLRDLENEIIEVKTKAFDETLRTLIPIKLLRSPYIKDYKKKLEKQLQILFAAVKKIMTSPKQESKKIIKNSFKLYYKKDPINTLLLMYVPSFIQSIKIKEIINKLERANFRFYKLKISETIAILNYLSKKKIDLDQDNNKILASVFPDENMVNAYLNNYIEREKKIYSIIKQGGSWKKTFSFFDAFSGFSITMIPFYRLTSNIRINILEALDNYVRNKLWNVYYKNSSYQIYTFKDCQEKHFRHKILYTFPASPEEVFEKFYDADILTKTNPEKSFKATRLSKNRVRYEITVNLLLLKMKIYWEAVSKYTYGDNFIFEEWHIENSNYGEYMDGFSLFERTKKNHCRYANVTKSFIPNEKLALLGEPVINQLENFSNLNTEQMMKNIYKLIISEKIKK